MRYSIRHKKEDGFVYTETIQADSEEDAIKTAEDMGLQEVEGDGIVMSEIPQKRDGSADMNREVKFNQSPRKMEAKIAKIKALSKLNNSSNK